MPSPVSFTVAFTSIPSNFSGTASQLGQAIADRLMVTPQDAWNSFQNGGSVPVSNLGPWLKNSNEWYVWNSGTGSYEPATQNGSGLTNATVTQSKLADFTGAGSVLISDGSKRPTELLRSSGSSTTQVLVRGASVPVWADPEIPGKSRFEANLSVDQAINTNGTTVPVAFNTVRHSAVISYDTGNYGPTVANGQVWFFYTALQLEDTAAASTGVQVQLRIHGPSTSIIGETHNFPTITSRVGVSCSGVIPCVATEAVYVDIAITEDTPDAAGMTVAANSDNTRFGGFRLY